MAKSSTRRIRCFMCENLVSQNFDDTIKNEQECDVPYAITTLTINKKRGCICSDCIETLNDNHLKNLAQINSDNGDKLRNDSDMLHVPNAEGNIKKSSATHDVPDEAHSKLAMQNTLNPGMDDDELYVMSARYKCLEQTPQSSIVTVEKTVFGQHEAAEKLITSLYLNQINNFLEDIGSDKPSSSHRHILLIGNTGVGKTLLATTAAKTFGVTYSVSNATPITGAGYIGEKVENILERLYKAANGSIDDAERGVVIIDEIDKKKAASESSSRDVAGLSVQQELLKILEPSIVWIYPNGHNSKGIPFDTSRLTVVMMGAFVGLDKIINQRTKATTSIGFSNSTRETDKCDDTKVTAEDIINFGFLPEFVGRISAIVQLNPLNADTLTSIIQSKLNDYISYFKLKSFTFNFSSSLVRKMAEQLSKSQTGARDVMPKLDEILLPALYSIFESKTGGVCEVHDDSSIEIHLNTCEDTQVSTVHLNALSRYVVA